MGFPEKSCFPAVAADCFEKCSGADEDDDNDWMFLAAKTDQMDWRAFRRNLAMTTSLEEETKGASSTMKTKTSVRKPSVCAENKDVLRSQSKQLHQEYQAVWAHVTATPEVGGLVVRLPLEIELHRNHKHSVTGARLRNKYNNDNNDDALDVWYKRAQSLIEADLTFLTDEAAVDGQIDATTLSNEMAEMLQLYLDNQENWQEVCLVLDQDTSRAVADDNDDMAQRIETTLNGEKLTQTTTATTLVLNRPMAMKLTENLGQLVLYGAFSTSSSSSSSLSSLEQDRSSSSSSWRRQNQKKRKRPELNRFMRAFGSECAVYIGGPDDQDQPAELIHGIADLPGAREIAPNTGIFRGGLEAAVDGVLAGTYKPLDFRFFVGRHNYGASTLQLSCLLGKYQPIACARAVALKQCISLPKPLWHEVMELCGGEMHQISQLEMEKRDDLQIQIVEDDEDTYNNAVEDELDELSRFDDVDEEDDEDGGSFGDSFYRRR